MVRMMRRFVVMALAGFLCVASPAGAADTVSAATKDGYGRLTFATGPTDQVTAQISGQVLTISFNRKMGLTPEGIAQSLPGYIASGRMDADGKTYRFALNQPVKLHTSAAPGKFALDLAPQSFTGAPPDLPQPPAPPKRETDINKMPVLKVRSGAYHNFTRVVFDWPKNVPYHVFPGSGKLTVRFDALVNPDFSALDREAPPWVKSAGWHIAGDSTIVDFTIDSASGFHDFRDGTHIVIDVLAPKTDADAYKPPGDAKPGVTPLQPAKGVVAAITDASKALAATGAPAKLTQPAKPTPPPPQQAAAKTTPVQVQPEQPAAPPATAPGDAATTVTQVADGHLTKDGAVLVFPGAGQQSVAVFMRGLNAWIILQDSPPLDIVRLKSQLGSFPTDVDASSGGGTTRLRIALRQPLSIAAFADGSSLKVVIAR